MAKIKDKQSGAKEYPLTQKEFNLLKILNLGLQFSTLKDKSISGVLYLICYNRLGYPEDKNYVFEVDLDADEGILKVSEVPTEAIQSALDK